MFKIELDRKILSSTQVTLFQEEKNEQIQQVTVRSQVIHVHVIEVHLGDISLQGQVQSEGPGHITRHIKLVYPFGYIG